MSEFVQLHLLTSYPPSNLNRDDLGRPKTAVMGGVNRLRVSSQSLKRAWRTSDLFQEALAGHLGTRTRQMGRRVLEKLQGLEEGKARRIAAQIAGVFGKVEKGAVDIQQLAHFSPREQRAIEELADTLATEKREPAEEELDLLRRDQQAVDIALFGRMIADKPRFNVEAAAQVAHAITAHEVAVEDDFFSAVDDLNPREEDVGAAHLGELEFGAGLFYLYVCVDRNLLVRNLEGNHELAGKALRALTEAAATISPTGKQNSFASRSYASYLLAEKGTRQPRSLAVAFLRPVGPRPGLDGYLAQAVGAVEATAEAIDGCYGATATERLALDTTKGQGTLAEVLEFVATPLPVGS